jgi:hypothetical protein
MDFSGTWEQIALRHSAYDIARPALNREAKERDPTGQSTTRVNRVMLAGHADL